MTVPVPTLSPLSRIDHLRTWFFVAFGMLGTLLVGYVAWLAFRHHFQYSMLWNGWIPDGFEFVVATLCIARGVISRSGRTVALLLGAGLLSWGFGDTVWTAQSITGATTPMRYLGAAFWLGFYPLAYAALVFLMRGTLRALSTPSLLDGAVAALGTAAVCAAFAFHGAAHSISNDTLTRATNIAFPIGDLLLFALVVGATAMLSGRSTLPWLVFATACLLNCLGDTFNLFQSTEGFLRVDAIFHILAWPTAGLLMAVAVWIRPRPVNVLVRQKAGGFLLPSLAAGAGLVVLIVASVDHVDRIALVLAVASLLVAGIRLVWSARGLEMLTEQRHRQSMTDELTGLGNRRFLFDVCDSFFFDQADGQAPRRSFHFLFVDLNSFKEVNDAFGHLAGDELLKQLGPRLTQSLGSADVLVRVGGDEFGVVLMDADADRAAFIAQELTNSLGNPFDLNGVSVSISASIGIASVPTDATDIGTLFECADVAMYRSKLGGSSFAFYDDHLDSGNQWRLGDELRVAIERRQFTLHYQPQIDLRTDDLSAVEALVRWRHPTLGMLGPSRFLPLAEQAGLMPPLTAMLIDDALTQGMKWRRAGRDLSISVNISATNLSDEGFTDVVKRLLDQHRFPATSLVLEITETSVIANFEKSRRVIEELANLGIVLSIDDFGAGFTSLSYLSSLAVRELKLDCKLITNLASESRGRDRELVRSTIELGHGLGLRVVAEGVEDEATLDLLRELRCDFAQGYYISRPKSADELDLALDTRFSSNLVSRSE